MNILTRIFKVKSKATVYFDKNGELIEATGNIGKTRELKAANYFRFNDVTPTLGMKLGTAIRNLFLFFRGKCKKNKKHHRGYTQRHSLQHRRQPSGCRAVDYTRGEQVGT